MHIGLYVKYPLFLSDFNETSTFSPDFESIQGLSCSVWIDRWTDGL